MDPTPDSTTDHTPNSPTDPGSQELVDFVADCLAMRKRKSVIRAELQHALGLAGVVGEVGYELVDSLIHLATIQMTERARQSMGAQKANIIATCERCIADPRSGWRDKMEASKMIAEILGTTATHERENKKLALLSQPTNSAGGAMSAEAAQKLAESLKMMEGQVNGESSETK